MNIKLPIYIIALLIFTGCRNNTVKITGTITNPMKEQYIYLAELMSKELKSVDSVKISEKGRFSFKLKTDSPAFYILKTSDRNFLTMLLKPGERVVLYADRDSLNYPSSISGSEGTQLMNEYSLTLRNTISKLSGLSNIYRQNITNPDLPRIIESLDSTAQVYLDEINAYTKKYIDDNLNSLVSLIALYQQVSANVYVLNPSKDYNYYLKVDSALSLLYPDYEPVNALHEQVLQLTSGMEGQTSGTNPAGMGAEAPEIILPSPQGDTIKLSSTRGSVVLLDFWASWCRPCRMENPNLVQAYATFHRKGFQIYQVSLDKTREAWIKGIEDDQLGKWIHVSDVMYWNSKVVQLYGIESIPSNYLLDRNGRIIAVNLRGEALQKKLEEIFKQ